MDKRLSLVLFIFVLLAIIIIQITLNNPHSVALFSKKDSKIPKGWAICGNEKDFLFKLSSAQIDPISPKRGKKWKVHIKGDLLETIDETAKVNYLVKFGVVPIVKDSTSICEALKQDPNLPQCPLQKGHWDYTYESEVPIEVPVGTFSVNANAYTADGRDIFCIQGSIHFTLLSEYEESSEFEEYVDSQ